MAERGRDDRFQPPLSLPLETRPRRSSAVSADAPPTAGTKLSAVSTRTSDGGRASATRRAVEWFWSAASLPAPWSIVPWTSTPLGRIRSSGRTAGGLRERTSSGTSVMRTTSSSQMSKAGRPSTISPTDGSVIRSVASSTRATTSARWTTSFHPE